MNKKLLKYWKNCLLDAEWSNSMFYKEPRVTLAFEDRMPESIPEEDIELLFPDEREDGKKCKVRIAPCVLLPEYENGKPIGKMFPEYPFFITATLGPDGSLQLPENPMDRVPMFVRKFLSPNAKDDRTLASLDEVDCLLSAFKTDVATEEEYWKACEALFRKATGMTFSEMNYPDQPEMIITKAPVTGMAQNILRLYDKLLECKEDLPLLECLTRCECEPLLPLPARREIYANKRHLAQMSSDFPLSVSQRETLAMYTHPRGSRIFAVNGPPGTGKTTFLQTVIANRLVHSVLTDGEPELTKFQKPGLCSVRHFLSNGKFHIQKIFSDRTGQGLSENVKILEHFLFRKRKESIFHLRFFLFFTIYIASADAGDRTVGWGELFFDFSNFFFIHSK